MPEKYVPEVTSTLRRKNIMVPNIIKNASGIRIYGKRIKSILFSTDVAIVKNSNADAIIAVYPFTPNPAITQSILSVADVPVLMGVGGGMTGGLRSVNVSLHAEFQGCLAVVFNSPASLETVMKTRETIDIPIILTVVSTQIKIQEKIDAGVDIFNVSGGAKTPEIVRIIRQTHPEFPIIATGGPTDESINETILAGANAITYTPPSNAYLMSHLMDEYRELVQDK